MSNAYHGAGQHIVSAQERSHPPVSTVWKAIIRHGLTLVWVLCLHPGSQSRASRPQLRRGGYATAQRALRAPNVFTPTLNHAGDVQIVLGEASLT